MAVPPVPGAVAAVPGVPGDPDAAPAAGTADPGDPGDAAGGPGDVPGEGLGEEPGDGAGVDGAAAPPGRLPGVPGVPGELLALHRELGAIGESYRIAEQDVLVRRVRAAVLAGRLVTIRARLTALRNEVGGIARAQYRSGTPGAGATGGDASAALYLLLAGTDPAEALEREATLRRIGEGAAVRIERLEELERRAVALAARARAELDAGQVEAERRRERRSEVRRRLDELREPAAAGAEAEPSAGEEPPASPDAGDAAEAANPRNGPNARDTAAAPDRG
ncbi:hypothetical protein [Streptomyces calidiresistens]